MSFLDKNRVKNNLNSLIAIFVRLIPIFLILLIVHESRPLGIAEALQRANTAYLEKRYAEAITDYRAVSGFYPTDHRFYERIINSAMAVHRPDVAIVYLRELTLQRGWTPADYRLMAALLTMQGDDQSALVYLRESLTGSVSDVEALRQLVYAEIEQQDWAAAEKLLHQWRTIVPVSSEPAYLLGLFLAPTNITAALDSLQQATVDPRYRNGFIAVDRALARYGGESPAALTYQLGLAMMQLEAWPFAERTLKMALADNPGNPEILAFLAIAQESQGRDAWLMLERAYLSAPDNAIVNYAMAVHWRLKGDTTKALAILERAGNADPTNAAIAAEIGIVHRQAGRYLEAAQWLLTAYNLAPDVPQFGILLATFYADERYDLRGVGLVTIKAISDQLPEDADVRASLGWAYFSTGQFNLAQIELEAALELDSQNVRARYYYGNFLEYAGDIDGAASYYLYVFRNAQQSFKDMAARSLVRINYRPEALPVDPFAS